MATTVLYLSEVKRACSLPAEMWQGNLSKRIFPDHIRVNSLGPMGNKMPQHNKLKSILWKRIYERCTMWHFILPFTDKHHADCHLRKLRCLWKSGDVGTIILMGNERRLCCWCVLVVPSGLSTSLTSKTILITNLYHWSSAVISMVTMVRLAPNQD